MDIHAKGLIQKDVVEHKFIGDDRKGGKGHTLLYSHTRMRARREQISTGRKGRIAVQSVVGILRAVLKAEKKLSWKIAFLLSPVTF